MTRIDTSHRLLEVRAQLHFNRVVVRREDARRILLHAGKKKVDKIVSDLAERVSSGRLPMQSAHSTNSELGAYSVVSRKPNSRRTDTNGV